MSLHRSAFGFLFRRTTFTIKKRAFVQLSLVFYSTQMRERGTHQLPFLTPLFVEEDRFFDPLFCEVLVLEEDGAVLVEAGLDCCCCCCCWVGAPS